MKTEILHNPRCKKSRDALEYLTHHSIPHTVVKYLDNPLGKKELKAVAKKLGLAPEMMVRKKEKKFKEIITDQNMDSDEQWFELLANHPALLERPIVIHGNQAAIGRPLEQVIELFE